MNCKAIDGLIRYLTRVIPDGLLLSIARFRFTWFNKCKRFAGLNFKCKLEVELIIKNCQLILGRVTESASYFFCAQEDGDSPHFVRQFFFQPHGTW